ncbi:MAG TPA: hypothetical protein ENN29_02060, partial [Candidatus Hydrogenedentes bacterium]|nr:hypothetical protein [Candidatus Hydrogenedentota bacterium]
ALLLLVLLHQLGAPRFVKATAPLFFVTHPLHTEAVAYISGRADMMSAIGIFGALCFAVSVIRLEHPFSGTMAATVFFVAGLLSKESTLIYPVLLAIVFAAVITDKERKSVAAEEEVPPLWRFMPLAASGVVLTVYMILRATVLRFARGQSSVAPSLSTRLVETFQSLGVYAKLLFIPTGLHMERTLHNVSALYILAGGLFFALLIAAITVSWRLGHKRIAAGFAWFLAAWFPVSGIFPLNAPLAEHWMYVPMAGFWWSLMEIVRHVCGNNTRRLKAAYAGAFLLCVVFIAATAQRNLDWHDNERLFRATLEQNPNTMRVHYNLAVTYDSIQENYAGARRHYERYLELRMREQERQTAARPALTGDDIEVRLSLGRVLMHLGEYEAAVNVLVPLKQLAEIDVWRPAAAMAAVETGKALLALGDIGQAHMYFQEALTIDPELYEEVENILSGMPFYDGY